MPHKSTPDTPSTGPAGWSRREFVNASLLAGLAGTAGGLPAAAAGPAAVKPRQSIYTRLLGVRPHLAGHGYTTVFGGSRMPVEVVRAMEEAGEEFVDLPELFEAAGRRLAEVTGAEAAIVTAGSYSGLLLGAAGVLSGTDPARVAALPQPTWPKRDCLIPKSHRLDYAKAFQVAGMRLVEIARREDFARAITPNTAMITGIASWERRDNRTPDIMRPQELIDLGRRAGVPVLMDIASELPPVENFKKYTAMGADLVVISGGKGLRGPQSTGILAGRKPLIEAARLHAFPHTMIGRGMKIGKEEIIGLIAAIDRFLALDHDALRETWIRSAQYVAAELQGIRGLKAEYLPPNKTDLGYDSVALSWDEKVIPFTVAEVHERLRAGEPRIIFRGALFTTRNLENGEEILFARRLKQFFSAAARIGRAAV